MDFGLLIVMSLFSLGLQWAMNRDEREQAKEDTLDIQHDAQEENARQAKINRDWQENFWKENQSPEALVSQYRNLGASESAALMSALGVSPSVASGSTASTGSAGGLGAGVNSISDMLNSLTGGFNSFMQGEKAREETKWIGPISQANIDRTLGDLELHKKEFGLAQDTYYNISKPLAEMSLNKTQQDIQESIARIDKIDEDIKMIEQQIKESKQNVNESIARTDLYNEQVNTEIFKQENLAADTSLKDSQTTGQDYENRLSALDVAISEETGINVRLGVSNQGALVVTTLSKRLSDNLPAPPFSDKSSMPWSEFINATKVTLNSLNACKLNQATGQSAYQYVWDYLNNHFKGKPNERQWLLKRSRYDKQARSWIDQNSRYGF